MRPVFYPALVNEPFGDPALFVDFRFERRAFLFDLGDLTPLPPRKILRITHAFVTHAHMDHFVGFDRVLRTCLHQEATLRLFGPPSFIDRVEHRLAAYTWNLVHEYPHELVVAVTEVHPDGPGRQAAFRSRAAFRREAVEPAALTGGVLLDEDAVRVRAAVLDHRIPCLAFALEEKAHVNVWRTRLDAMGLPSGPWLGELKRAVVADAPADTPFRVWWREGTATREVHVPLGRLRELVSVTPGQKIGYVVDAAHHPDNARRIVDLVRDADVLFVETPFLQDDAEMAARKHHLTARQAGLLAREAGVKRLVPFHFSPRYTGEGERLHQEALDAFAS